MIADLQQRELAARIKAHRAPIYLGDSVLSATRSSIRACALSNEWMRLRSELKSLGIEPLSLESRHD